MRTSRALRLRSVPSRRSTNGVSTARLDVEHAEAASTASAVTKMILRSTLTTRPLLRVSCTVAQVWPAGGTLYGLRGRPRLPVRGGVIASPYASGIAPRYGA